MTDITPINLLSSIVYYHAVACVCLYVTFCDPDDNYIDRYNNIVRFLCSCICLYVIFCDLDDTCKLTVFELVVCIMLQDQVSACKPLFLDNRGSWGTQENLGIIPSLKMMFQNHAWYCLCYY